MLGRIAEPEQAHSISQKAGDTYDPGSGARKARPAPAYRFEVYSDPRHIEAAWRELEQVAAVPWHQSFDYVSSWCETTASSSAERPFIVAGYDGDGKLGFIWPLAVHGVFEGLVLRWLGQDHGGYFFGVYRPDVLASIDRTVLADFVSWLRACEPCVVALQLELQPREFDGMQNPFQLLPYCIEEQPTFFVRIDSNFTDFCNERFSSKTRRTLRKKRTDLLALGARFEFAKTVEQGSAIYDTFLRQKREQLARTRESNPFASPSIERLYRSLIGPAASPGSIQHSSVQVHGVTAATCSVVDFKGRLYLLQMSMQAGVAGRSSPGLLLLETQMMRRFGSAPGVMDFGPGEGSHKAFWKCEQMSRFATLHPVRERGWLLVLRGLALAAAKRAVKSSPIGQRIREWRSRGESSARTADQGQKYDSA